MALDSNHGLKHQKEKTSWEQEGGRRTEAQHHVRQARPQPLRLARSLLDTHRQLCREGSELAKGL